MKLTIELQMDNAAFEVDPIREAERGIIRALSRLVELSRLEPGNTVVNILDANGNNVGYADLEV